MSLVILFTEPIRVDLGDILAVVGGVVFGLSLVFVLGDSPTLLDGLFPLDTRATDLLIGISALGSLHLKRTLWPGLAGHPTCGFLVRSIYLLVAISGCALLVGSLIEGFASSRRNDRLIWEQDPLLYSCFSLGLFLVSVTLLIDRHFLRREPPGSENAPGPNGGNI